MNQPIISMGIPSQTKKKKTRKAPMKNATVIAKLMDAGLITCSNIETQCTEFCKPFKKILSHSYYGYTRDTPKRSYYIPIDIYKKYIVKTFRPQFPIGVMVRLRDRSTRKYERCKWNQDCGDTQDWKHLGMGSGKEYHSDKVNDILDAMGYSNANNYYAKYRRKKEAAQFSSNILIGNYKYCTNLIWAYERSQYFKNNNIKRQPRSRWDRHLDITPEMLVKHITIRGDGIFGPKKLINGFITNVYIHFLQPDWVSKRESRYEILFETGSRGIFTNDYIERVYDTDFDVDEKLMAPCEPDEHFIECVGCPHSVTHIGDEHCQMMCNNTDPCQALYDYTNLMDTTHGKALDYVKAEDDD